MNKVVFLDRDGTINVDFGYVHEIEKLEFMPELLESLSRIREAGYKLIIVTNQSGIGRGRFSEGQYDEFMSYMLKTMAESGAKVDKVYTCPHIDEDMCECRKPKTKMFEDATREFDIDLENSFAVGDRLRDLKFCEKSNVKGVLYRPKIEHLNSDDGEIELPNYCVAIDSWSEIADYICGFNK